MTQSGMGSYAQVGDILLQSVHVEAPQGTGYEPGDEARLWLTLLNDGREPDTLVSVTTPVAANAEIRWDSDCDGAFETIPTLPLRPAGLAPVQTPAGIPPFDAYHVRLVNIDRGIIAGTTIPVTFTFQRAGKVTMEAIVQPTEPPRAEPSLRCHAPSTPDNPQPLVSSAPA